MNSSKKIDHNLDHIAVNLRPTFISNLATYDPIARIYAYTLPKPAFNECLGVCELYFAYKKIPNKNAEFTGAEYTAANINNCKDRCIQRSQQIVNSSEAEIASQDYCKTVPHPPNTNMLSSTKYFDPKCLKLNSSKIKKGIKKICSTDEVCNVNNNSIFEIMVDGGLASPKFYVTRVKKQGGVDGQQETLQKTIQKPVKHRSRHTRSGFHDTSPYLGSNDNIAEYITGILLLCIVIGILFIVF